MRLLCKYDESVYDYNNEFVSIYTASFSQNVTVYTVVLLCHVATNDKDGGPYRVAQ